jgi:D-alanyl-D-alanine dipeptidase
MSRCALALLYLISTAQQIALASDLTDADAVTQAAMPHEPEPALMRWVGQYGTEDSLVTIYEDHGQLYADGRGLHQAPLKPKNSTSYWLPSQSDAKESSTLTLVLDHGGPGIRWGGVWLPRIDVGALVVERMRAQARSDASALRASALQKTPPIETAPRRPSDLLDLASIPSIKFDIRYATSNNFMGFPLYDRPAAYLQRPAAEALGRVAQQLAKDGFGLLVYDAYRPWFVSQMFWDATPESAHMFVADPAAGSRHNRGCAVDLTLYHLSSGDPVHMTGRYDEMSRRSYADFIGGTSEQRSLRDLLRRAMEAEGFTVYPQEWWHFDYKDWDQYAIGNATFDELRAAAAR